MVNLQTRNLSCGYRDRVVLEKLSIEARAGEVLVLLGANGSGKTTLLRAMSRLLRPTHGAVLLEGRDMWTLGRRETARKVALTPQTERRDWPLTVEHAVGLGRAPHRGWLAPLTSEDKRIVEDALSSTGLCELRDRPITELSGGEWRRMVLARALAQQAQALLLDEPTAGLDLKYQVEILRLVRTMARDNSLVVIVTLHDLNYASIYADRVAVLHEQSLIALGTPKEVLTEAMISKVFGVPVVIAQHPVYGTPMVVPSIEMQQE